jgi:caa(3)-type oxidase subunit IV
MSHTQDKSSAYAQGVLIFVYLAVLTALEYFVAITFSAVPILVLIAVIKAALVMYYYMHIYKLNEFIPTPTRQAPTALVYGSFCFQTLSFSQAC